MHFVILFHSQNKVGNHYHINDLCFFLAEIHDIFFQNFWHRILSNFNFHSLVSYFTKKRLYFLFLSLHSESYKRKERTEFSIGNVHFLRLFTQSQQTIRFYIHEKKTFKIIIISNSNELNGITKPYELQLFFYLFFHTVITFTDWEHFTGSNLNDKHIKLWRFTGRTSLKVQQKKL